MGIFDFAKKKDIREGYRKFLETPGAYLLDVRERYEFNEGNLARSRSFPLSQIDKIESLVRDKSAPVFVYCQSGKRSKEAEKKLRKMGYTNVTDIGGIEEYNGKLRKQT
ncbi:MAG: rhodanese-like domain-containing protein [Lachnospiraceae bacterium]|nr:rhodanese-like domain-containing protein [Lachnospiraceae bacterium]